MADPTSSHFPIVVIKIGGSVLTDPAAYRRAAAFVAQRCAERTARDAARLVIVVSAEHGVTDALLRTARELSADPDPTALDLLWSTGELRSVALLVLALQGLGINAAAVNVHQTGLVAPDATVIGPAGHTHFEPARLRSLLATHRVVVVPGFLAVGDGDAVVSLGRGGSDLTAVLLAAGLAAEACELIKDVDGYFDLDPRTHAGATHIPDIDYTDALRMADDGCELVQRAALDAARTASLPVVVRALHHGRGTRVRESFTSVKCEGGTLKSSLKCEV